MAEPVSLNQSLAESVANLPSDHPVTNVINIVTEKFVSKSAKRMKDLDLIILRECKELSNAAYRELKK